MQTLIFASTTVAPNTTGSFYIDLSQCASIVNRRFYRQGINWAVAGFKVSTLAPAGAVTIRKAQDTWMTSGAWEKTMRHWLKQQNEAIADAGAESAVAKFRDYKVFLDDEHVTATFANNLIPIDGNGAAYLQGEWEASQVVLPNVGAPGNTAEYNVKLYGASGPGVKGIMQGYADSRAYPFSPDPQTPAISTGWIGDMFDVGDDQDAVLQNATDTNDELPYDQQNYPGQSTNAGTSMIHDTSFITNTTVGGHTFLKGGQFPCGLIRVDFSVDEDAPTSYNVVLQIDLVPGNHRGYLCEPMTEM